MKAIRTIIGILIIFLTPLLYLKVTRISSNSMISLLSHYLAMGPAMSNAINWIAYAALIAFFSWLVALLVIKLTKFSGRLIWAAMTLLVTATVSFDFVGFIKGGGSAFVISALPGIIIFSFFCWLAVRQRKFPHEKSDSTIM